MNFEGYLLCIIGTSVFASVVLILIPEGKTSGIVKGIAKLVCLLSIVSPVVKILEKGDIFEYFQGKTTNDDAENNKETVITLDESYINYFCTARVAWMQDEIERLLLARFKQEVTAELEYTYSWEDATLTVTSVRLITGNALTESARKAIRECLGEYGYETVEFA